MGKSKMLMLGGAASALAMAGNVSSGGWSEPMPSQKEHLAIADSTDIPVVPEEFPATYVLECQGVGRPCGIKSGPIRGTQVSVIKEAHKVGFTKIGDLAYCRKCAKKAQKVQGFKEAYGLKEGRADGYDTTAAETGRARS